MSESPLKGKHRSNRRYRFKDNPEEKHFADAWEQQCDRGHLEWLLGDGCTQATDVSERDALVAASVIQWLGTLVGQCFLRELGYVMDGKIRAEHEARIERIKQHFNSRCNSR